MRKILKNFKVSYADLYYNDVCGLKITLKEIKTLHVRRRKELESMKSKVNDTLSNKKFINHILNIQLMGLIYWRRFEEIKVFTKENRNIEILEDTVDLVLGLDPSISLIKISLKILENYYLQEETKNKL